MSRESGSSGSGVQGLESVLGLLRSTPEEGKHSVANGENQGIPVGSAVNHAATDPGRAPRPPVEPPKDRSLSGSVPDPNSRGSSRAQSHPTLRNLLSEKKEQTGGRTRTWLASTHAEPPEGSSW
ncbi:unnamed protein product [Boreogadus saida]